MFRKLIATDNDFATTILRLALGVIFFAHGAQKALGWFGGYGFAGTIRIAAFGPFCNMIVAVAMIHHNFGFFMNWTGTQKGEGYEYHLLLLAASAFLMIRGAGAASIDRLLSSPSNHRIKVQARLQAA